MKASYCFNEAMLVLPDAYAVVDRSRQFLEIETSNGVKLVLIVARAPADGSSPSGPLWARRAVGHGTDLTGRAALLRERASQAHESAAGVP